jgi:hypothetical protein
VRYSNETVGTQGRGGLHHVCWYHLSLCRAVTGPSLYHSFLLALPACHACASVKLPW